MRSIITKSRQKVSEICTGENLAVRPKNCLVSFREWLNKELVGQCLDALDAPRLWMSLSAKVVFSSTFPVRKPLPSGL
jgi:hypothetical protein